MMQVKPREPGLVIRDPRTRRPLPPQGGPVPDSSYWRRRLLDGDVVLLLNTDKENPDAELQRDP
jgi:hypothetical protein